MPVQRDKVKEERTPRWEAFSGENVSGLLSSAALTFSGESPVRSPRRALILSLLLVLVAVVPIL